MSPKTVGHCNPDQHRLQHCRQAIKVGRGPEYIAITPNRKAGCRRRLRLEYRDPDPDRQRHGRQSREPAHCHHDHAEDADSRGRTYARVGPGPRDVNRRTLGRVSQNWMICMRPLVPLAPLSGAQSRRYAPNVRLSRPAGCSLWVTANVHAKGCRPLVLAGDIFMKPSLLTPDVRSSGSTYGRSTPSACRRAFAVIRRPMYRITGHYPMAVPSRP
jgi:hypothetical protein